MPEEKPVPPGGALPLQAARDKVGTEMRRRPKNELDSRALDRLATDPGLCASCVHLRLLSSPRSVFVRCGKAEDDPEFARYPPLPVWSCAGYQRSEGAAEGEP